jgi:hypothetical protein
MRVLSPCTKAIERMVAWSDGARLRQANGTSDAELMLWRLRYRSLM